MCYIYEAKQILVKKQLNEVQNGSCLASERKDGRSLF